jgi:UDP-GlcNAc3NAcA epimerase
LGKIGKEFYLSTVHRAENTDNIEHLSDIMDALNDISESVPVVLPLHPRTKKLLKLNNIKTNNIYLCDPVGYFDMLSMLKECKAIFTDSGGLQKEAYFLNKMCITLRKETEWVELVEGGYNILAGSTKEVILKAEASLNGYTNEWDLSLYGDGNAGEKIVNILMS